MSLFIARLVLIPALCVASCLTHAGWLPMDFYPQVPPPPRNLPEAQELSNRKVERTPERIADIKAEMDDATFRFWDVAGIDSSNCPGQSAFIFRVAKEAEPLILKIKADFHRSRPHLVLPDIDPVIPVPWHAAYPSGHATQSYLLYQVFETWYPAKAYAFERMAFRIADNREVAGVHYRSDGEAGRGLARLIFSQYMRDAEFMELLEKPCN